jgi:small subunit ribosomal protein S18
MTRDFSATDPSTFSEELRKLPPGKRPCPFDKRHLPAIDWKDYPTLKKFVDYFGNIKKRHYTGVCLKHQKQLKQAIDRARFMGLLPYRN